MSAVDSAKTWINDKPKQAMAALAVVGLIVGIVLGFGAGYKVEHDRTASDVSRLKKGNASSKTTKTTKPGTKKPVNPNGPTRRVGVVTAESATSITFKTKTGTATVTLSATTPVDRSASGAIKDVTNGVHVLVAPGPEILVLRTGSTLGRSVQSTTSDSVTLAAENGLPPGKLKTKSTTPVDTVTAATASDVKVGDHILVFGTAKAGVITGSQVIIIPATSKFAA